MTWEIVAGISVLLGMAATIISAAAKLSRSLAALDTSIKTLNQIMSEQTKNNREQHKEFYHKLDDHEGRIIILEHKH